MTTAKPQPTNTPIPSNSPTSKKKLFIGLGIAGAVVLGGLAAVAVYNRLSNSKNGYATGGTFTAEAIANLTSEAGGISGRGSPSVALWTILLLALLGAIAGVFYWWWSRGQNEQKEG